MKTLKYFIVAIVVLSGFTSCGTINSLQHTNNEAELAGYTLKNKVELMQQKILYVKKTTVIVAP